MTRTAFPTRRDSDVISFHYGNFKFYASWSTSIDTNQVFEIFLQAGKSGTELEAVARDGAIAVSLALQHGCPLQTLQAAMTRLDTGRAAGPLGAALDEISKAINMEAPAA